MKLYKNSVGYTEQLILNAYVACPALVTQYRWLHLRQYPVEHTSTVPTWYITGNILHRSIIIVTELADILTEAMTRLWHVMACIRLTT